MLLGTSFRFRDPTLSGMGIGRRTYLCDWTVKDLIDVPTYLCQVEGLKGEWYVHISLVRDADGNRNSLGPFKTRKDAAEAYAKQHLREMSVALEMITPKPHTWGYSTNSRPSLAMTLEQAERVFKVLEDWNFGALSVKSSSVRREFIYHHMYSDTISTEYRLGGWLGFGGKFRNSRASGWYVDCYREDFDELSRYRIANININLYRLWMEFFGDDSRAVSEE